MGQSLPVSKQAADDLMNQIVAVCNTFSWDGLIRPEFIVWGQLWDDETRLDDETIRQLKEKYTTSGGWWVWDSPSGFHGNGRFVSAHEWDRLRAEVGVP
jgi:hypothetical protein